MGLRIRKSIRLGSGVRLNLSRRSVGLSGGVRGFTVSANSSGRVTRTVSAPGTGISHTSTLRSPSGKAGARSGAQTASRPAAGPTALPKPGLFAPAAERRFYGGLQAYLADDLPRALKAFEAASEKDSRNVSDDFFAGLVSMRMEQRNRAILHLEEVVRGDIELPDQLLEKYLPPDRVAVSIMVSITSRVSAPVQFDSLGAALILAELYQEAGRREDAIGLLQQLRAATDTEPVLTLSLCDLLYEDEDFEGVIETASSAENDADVGVACLHLKAKALALQGLKSAALATFSACLRRTAGRDRDLLKEIRYDRATYREAIGDTAKARADWEKLYAEDPRYRDVARKVRG